MKRYCYSDEVRTALESLKQAMAVYQVIDGQVVTLLISDGFRKLFGYPNREQAVFFMDHDMYKDIHPDDRTRLTEAALHFADSEDDDELEVVYRKIELHDRAASAARVSFSLRTWISSAASSRSSRV